MEYISVKSVNHTAKAIQFINEPHHPLLYSPEPKLPEGVYKKKFTDYQDPAPYYKYGIDIDDDFVELKHKDWIVKKDTGEVIVLSNKKFKESYSKY